MNKKAFEKIIKYTFNNKDLLEKALTHSSFCRENNMLPRSCNERLEFLGDAFFDAIIGVELYKRLDKVDEGKLTKTRASIVCEKSLANVGIRLNIGQYLNMGKGEENCGGRTRDSIIADAMEAIIGAIYLDGGYEAASKFVNDEFKTTVEEAINGDLYSDYKTQVQELLQSKGKGIKIAYYTDREEGPDHDKTFYVHLECNGKIMGHGCGKSKKEAEQHAAQKTLERGI